MTRVIDLHCHIVPGIDDGAQTVVESLEILKSAEAQGVTDIFCTSHGGYCEEDGKKYLETLEVLIREAKKEGININLHKGTEILCDGKYMQDVILGLGKGTFQTLGNSDYVLTEFYPDVKITEALNIVESLKKNGYTPIIAHMERNINITWLMTKLIVNSGAFIQVNAFSLDEESDERIKLRARELLDKQLIHFIGSDSHRTCHRPPRLENGVSYVREKADKLCAKKIIYENALSFGLI